MSLLRQSVWGVPLPWLILFLAVSDLLLAFPGIDLAVSGAFASPAGFPAHGRGWERALYHSIPFLMVTLNLSLLGTWLWSRIDGRPRFGITGRKLTLLLLLLALVPGLLLNQIFKEHWGRARPAQLAQFGGQKTFTPAFVISDQGGGSFSSGHAAAAAYTIAVAATLAGPRAPWVAAALLYTALVGLARIAAGGHFFSDVIISILLVWVGFLMLRHLLRIDDP
jgi:lipid A 4'-phosphatase